MLNDTSSILALLKSRKSASAKAMAEPGPTPAQLSEILSLAVRVPDHGKLAPWRFILWEGDVRASFGEVMKARWHELHPEPPPYSLSSRLPPSTPRSRCGSSSSRQAPSA
jgi:nitroreductase